MSTKLRTEIVKKNLAVCSFGEAPSITTSIHPLHSKSTLHIESAVSKTHEDAVAANEALAKRVATTTDFDHLILKSNAVAAPVPGDVTTAPVEKVKAKNQ